MSWVVCVQVGMRGQHLQYDGEWVRGSREGRGTCYYYNEETYSGKLLLRALNCGDANACLIATCMYVA